MKDFILGFLIGFIVCAMLGCEPNVNSASVDGGDVIEQCDLLSNSSPEDWEVANILIVLDMSSSLAREAIPPLDQLVAYIERMTAVSEDGGNAHAVNVFISTIGHGSRPETKHIPLPPGAGFWSGNMKDRQDKIEDFRDALRAALKDLLERPADEGQSYVHRSIAYAASVMLESAPRGPTTILVLSDGLLQSDQFNFFSYAKDLKGFQEKFGEISKELNDLVPMPDLSCVEVIMVHEPQPAVDEMMVYSDRFWREHLLAANAKRVLIRSNLN